MKKFFVVSFFDHQFDNSAKEEILTYEEMPQLFSNPDIHPRKDGRLISGTIFNDGYKEVKDRDDNIIQPVVFVKKLRSNKTAIESSLLILDFDHDKTIDLNKWDNLNVAYFYYTSFSHGTPKKPCAYRVVIPLLKPIPATSYQFLFEWVKDYSPSIDAKCKDISRIMYLPSCPQDRVPLFQHGGVIDKPFLEWEKYIEPYQVKHELEQIRQQQTQEKSAISESRGDYSAYVKRVIEDEISNVRNASEGCRNDTLNKGAFALGQLVSATWANVDEYESESLLLDAAQNCGLDENEARITIKSGLDSGKSKPREIPSDTNPNNFPSEVKSDFSLEKFDLTSKLDDLKIRATKEQYILKDIALVGQITAIYAPPNTGKTLIVLHLIIEQIKSGLESKNIFYINADDSYNGLVEKAAMAKEFGFKMLASNEEGFNLQVFFKYLKTAINGNSCNEIVIVDTLKKFANLMDKKSSSDFMKLARAYVQKGGTMILLAHTNKNKSADGKHKYGGTSDVVDDCDCAYVASESSENETSKKVIFENIKRRGSNKIEVAFEYSKDFENYTQLMKSVKNVTASVDAEKDRYLTNAIKETIIQGFTNKTVLISTAKKFPKCSKSKIEYALDKYEDVYWKSTFGNKNSQVYQLK